MFDDPLQKRLEEMELDYKSPSLENQETTWKEKNIFLKRKLKGSVKQIPQKTIHFENYEDELNYQIQKQNFYRQAIDKKVEIYTNIVKNAKIKPIQKESILEFYLEDVLEGRLKPSEDFHDSEFEGENKIPKQLVEMLQSIYLDVIPEKGKEQANNWRTSAMKHLRYALTHKESGNALNTAIASMRLAVDYLIESKFGVGKNEYKQIGNAFLNTGFKLHEQKKQEARRAIGIALNYFEEGNIQIPTDIKENWEQYEWNETENLRTDWQTENSDLIKLLN